MKRKILVRDREGTELQVASREEYKTLLFDTLHSKLTTLQHNAKTKEEMYVLLSDITELTNCIGTQHLTMKTERASLARYTAFTKTNKGRAETKGGFFDGKYVEVMLDS